MAVRASQGFLGGPYCPWPSTVRFRCSPQRTSVFFRYYSLALYLAA